MTVTSIRQAPTAAYPRRWAAAIVMMVAALMDLIDVTIVNVALPTIRRDLHASGTQLEWVVSAYLLAFAVTLITAGRGWPPAAPRRFSPRGCWPGPRSPPGSRSSCCSS